MNGYLMPRLRETCGNPINPNYNEANQIIVQHNIKHRARRDGHWDLRKSST